MLLWLFLFPYLLLLLLLYFFNNFNQIVWLFMIIYYYYYFHYYIYYQFHYFYLFVFFFIFFHQFEQDVLEACLFLLERGRVAMTEWRDPVIVSRMVSALVSHIHMTSTYIHRKSSIWQWFEKVTSSGTACGSFRFMGIYLFQDCTCWTPELVLVCLQKHMLSLSSTHTFSSVSSGTAPNIILIL